MFGRTRRFWTGVALLVIGAALLFESYIPGFDGPIVLLAIGVVVLAAGTLMIAVERGQRPV